MASAFPARRVMYVSARGNLLGGAEVCLLETAIRIKEHGWDPLVVVPYEGDLTAALSRAGVQWEVVELGSFRTRLEIRGPILVPRLLAALVAGWRLNRLIRRRNVVLVHSFSAPVIAGAVGAWLARVPHVWHLREILDGFPWRVLRWLMVRLAARQVCISQAVAETMTGARGARVVVIGDGVDVDFFTPAAAGGHEPTASPVVAMVARIHPLKGHELFLRAAQIAHQQVPGSRFLLIGGCLPVYEELRRQLIALRDDLGLSDVATFLRHIDRSEMPGLFRGTTVVVVPSIWVEPGGLVALEAMACGIPVVATRRGGPAEVITDGVDGFLVSHEDPGQMAARVQQLIEDPGLRAGIGGAGRRRVTDAYSLTRHVEKISALYSEVVSAAEAGKASVGSA